ncbi:MAG: alpha/beta hydrolase [Pseudomonadota bacterium]
MKQLRPALEADLVGFDSEAGELKYYEAGEGLPLLLIHSINAAGSAYEVKPIFDHYRATRRIYALDLPGFGLSERSDRRYDIALYTSAISAMTNRIVAKHKQPIDALALSLSSEFLARAAMQAPETYRRLALVTPTGFRASDANRRAAPMSSREIGWLSGLLSLGSFGSGAFNLLTKPRSVRYFLKKTFGSDSIDEGLWEYAVATAGQPGAEYAPLAFISGRLFANDIRTVYEGLKMPVFLGHGTRGDFTDFRGADWARNEVNWTIRAFMTGALPHFETPDRFFAALNLFFD